MRRKLLIFADSFLISTPAGDRRSQPADINPGNPLVLGTKLTFSLGKFPGCEQSKFLQAVVDFPFLPHGQH